MHVILYETTMCNVHEQMEIKKPVCSHLLLINRDLHVSVGAWKRSYQPQICNACCSMRMLLYYCEIVHATFDSPCSDTNAYNFIAPFTVQNVVNFAFPLQQQKPIL